MPLNHLAAGDAPEDPREEGAKAAAPHPSARKLRVKYSILGALESFDLIADILFVVSLSILCASPPARLKLKIARHRNCIGGAALLPSSLA